MAQKKPADDTDDSEIGLVRRVQAGWRDALLWELSEPAP
jgi:hypothetical protein